MEEKKQSKATLLFIIVAIIISGTLSCVATLIITSFSGGEGKEPLPEKIIQTEVNPNGQATALLFEGVTGESMNFLGSDRRSYLGIKRNHVTYIIAHDLTEGFGSYEGGVLNIKWLDDQQILIERIIAGQQNNIIFNVHENRWLKNK